MSSLRLKNDYWAIETKSHQSLDAPNTIHKIFGKLLKESSKNREIPDELNLKYGLLLSDEFYYDRGFRRITRKRFLGFGKLIPISKVFVLSNDNLTIYNLEEFYDLEIESTS